MTDDTEPTSARPRADRVAFLVDAEAYFGALAEALELAERSVTIVGWDVHSRVRLRRGAGEEDSELGPMLDRLTSRRPELEVRVLAWDFAMVYAAERELLPEERWAIETGERVQFRLDGRHPAGASQHQKLVVIDERLAFVGGLDLTARRWDTPEHRPDDERRVAPWGAVYDPFHDIQAVVDGAAAAALGAVARTRWERATGESVEAARGARDPWPASVEPEMRDVEVAIALTEPAFDDRPERREIESLYLGLIDSARSSIYLENQFFSSHVLGAAIERRLAEPDAPEVVIVLPRRPESWLEDVTIGQLQARVLLALLEADRHDRVRVYQPQLASPKPDQAIIVHSKLCVVDGRRMTVGSANLTNRSMGLDSECNIAIDADERDDVAEAVAALRDRLLAEHLDVEPARFSARVAAGGSLIGAIEALRGAGRTLGVHRPRLAELPEFVDEALALLDPERPLSLEQFVSRFGAS